MTFGLPRPFLKRWFIFALKDFNLFQNEQKRCHWKFFNINTLFVCSFQIVKRLLHTCYSVYDLSVFLLPDTITLYWGSGWLNELGSWITEQLDSQSQVIKFTSCLPMVDGSLLVLRLLSPLKLVAMIKLNYCWKWR